MKITLARFILVLLLLVSGAVSVRFMVWTVGALAAPERCAERGFDVDPETLRVVQVRRAAVSSGLEPGDRVTAIDGAPVRSYLEARRLQMLREPGELLWLTVERAGQPARRTGYRVPSSSPPAIEDIITLVAINLLTPAFCLGLGFLVALRRPRNPVAWAALWLLVSMAFVQYANGDVRYSWGPWYTWPALLLDGLAGGWPAAWLALALLFPEPRSPHRRWPRLGWALLLPYAGYIVARSVLVAAFLHEPGAWAWVRLVQSVPDWLNTGWRFALVGLGLANCYRKLRLETRASVRRRLRWMVAGLTLGIAPYTVLLASSSLLGKDLNSYPAWLLLPGVITPFFIPLTLAYSVLVDRLFDVGVAVREGLLASKTVAAARALLIGLLLYLASTRRNWVAVALCGVGVLLTRQVAEWLRVWVDRRFFQEAVSAEQVLVDLSQQVRYISDREALIETVTRRVSEALYPVRIAMEPPESGLVLGTHAEALGEELLVPVSTSEEVYGVLRLGPKRSEEPYSRRDIQLLELVASQTALTLEILRLSTERAEEAAQRERLNSELEITRQVQQRLLPRSAPSLEGLQLAGCARPALTVGGDYYDYLEAPNGEWGLAIGDVAGKGVPAALLMAGLRSSLRGLTLAGIEQLGELMAKLNRLVYDSTPANRFATFFYGLYAPGGGFRYATAGHNPVLLLRASGEPEWLKAKGVGLGLTRRAEFEECSTSLRLGDVLVLYTDGVTEALSEQGQEFGEERLVEAVRGGGTATEVLARILARIEAFTAGAPQHDDITLIVAQRSA